jgi:hypothetical protein
LFLFPLCKAQNIREQKTKRSSLITFASNTNREGNGIAIASSERRYCSLEIVRKMDMVRKIEMVREMEEM